MSEGPTLYKYLSQEQLKALVKKYDTLAEEALDDNERRRLKHKARRARQYLPPQKCALDGCDVICEDGKEFCCANHAGQANSLMRHSATKEQIERMLARRESKLNKQPKPIYSDAEVVRVPEIKFEELWNGRGGDAMYCPVM